MSWGPPQDLVARTNALAAKALRARPARPAPRDPTEPTELDLDDERTSERTSAQASARMPQDVSGPTTPRPSPPSAGDSKRPPDPGPSVDPTTVQVAADGSRWALRCYCGRHPYFPHDAKPLPPLAPEDAAR